MHTTRNDRSGWCKVMTSGKSPSDTSVLLSVRHLTVLFTTDDGVFRAAHDVSFDIGNGECVGLVGESGCGKSVTALSIMRLLPSPPASVDPAGCIRFQGEDLLTLPSSRLRSIRGRDISMVFQEPMSALSPLQRIETQMAEAVRLHRRASRRDALALSRQWLQKVGIPDVPEKMRAYPYQLSGGMQQRVMIAMALMLGPRLLIADEPTTALDVTVQAQIFELMRQMRRDVGAVLLITHDMGVVWEMCDRVMVMYAGRVVETGRRDDVFFRPGHPYTRGLLDAIPGLEGRRRRLKTIAGSVPSLYRLPSGCPFCDRCPVALENCRRIPPPPVSLSEGHWAACLRAGECSGFGPASIDGGTGGT